MLKNNKAFTELSDEEYRQALDLPIWISLLAAFAHDGNISENERAEAIRIAHMRSFTAPDDIREYALQVYRNFDARFEQLVQTLPDDQEKRISYIKNKVRAIYDLIPKLDSSVAEDLIETLESFYKHVFVSDRSFLQYFALPIYSKGLDNTLRSEHFDNSKE